jgi:hypothetical protein
VWPASTPRISSDHEGRVGENLNHVKAWIKRRLGRARWERARMRWWQLKRALEIDHSALPLPWFVKSASPDLALLHRLAIKVDWDYVPHVEARISLWLMSILWPIASCRHVVVAARQYGTFVMRTSGVPVWRQRLDMWVLANRHNVPPLSYYQCRLFEPRNQRCVDQWIHYFEICNLLPELNRDRPAHLLGDKDRFAGQLAAFNLPGIPVISSFSNGQIDDGLEPDRLPEVDLVLKPVDLCSGARFERWSFESGQWSNGRLVLDAAGLLDYCRQQSLEHRHVMQPRVFNHPDIQPLAGHGLCTVRIVTCRPLDGPPAALFAAFRMPTGKAQVDNFNAGGVAAPVDLSTGVLGPGVARYLTDGAFDTHPTSGAPIAGFQLPLWSEAVALTLRAHDCFPWMPFVGWDVVISPDMPRLLEANMTWSAELYQRPQGKPLGSTQFTPVYIEHYRSRSAETGLPTAGNR